MQKCQLFFLHLYFRKLRCCFHIFVCLLFIMHISIVSIFYIIQCTKFDNNTLGCPGFAKKLTKILSRIYVINQGKIMHYLNFQSFPSPFTIWKLHLKYTKEILKNTKEIIGQRDFQFLPLTIFLQVIWDSGLHTCGPYASFDTCIVIYMNITCYMSYTSYMTYMAYMTEMAQ